MSEITLPYNFNPREYQIPLLKALDNGYKRAVAVWHRRAGKDLVMINYIAKRMYERVGAYYYFFPTYSQSKKVIWDGMTRDGEKFTNAFPVQLRKRTDNGEMLIEMNNGSIFRLIGTDKIDAVMGSNPVGCVFQSGHYRIRLLGTMLDQSLLKMVVGQHLFTRPEVRITGIRF